MAVRYYDDILVEKLMRWIPDDKQMRILKPDETRRLFEVLADDSKDKKVKLPLITLSRDKEIELLMNVKTPKSYDGLVVASTLEKTLQFNVIPIKISYQLDIYTKTMEEGDEYLRNFIFKLINNPVIVVEIPYYGTNIRHKANIRVLSNVSDTSDISERLFPGQFTRWSIQLEIQDAYLFSMPYRKNWKLIIDGDEIELPGEETSVLELSDSVEQPGYESEPLNFKWQKTD